MTEEDRRRFTAVGGWRQFDKNAPLRVETTASPDTALVVAPLGTRSRFYDNDQADPDAPRVLSAYCGPHHGHIRPGDRVVYENPAWRQPDGSYKTGGMDGEMTVTELVDLGGGHPPTAILDGGVWEVSAGNLRCVRRAAQDPAGGPPAPTEGGDTSA